MVTAACEAPLFKGGAGKWPQVELVTKWEVSRLPRGGAQEGTLLTGLTPTPGTAPSRRATQD